MPGPRTQEQRPRPHRQVATARDNPPRHAGVPPQVTATASRLTRQQRAVELALLGHPPAAIARTLGVSLRTVERYLAAAAPQLTVMRRARLARLTDRLAAAADPAVEALRAIVADPTAPHAGRVRAAAVLLAEARAWAEAQELAARVEDLEHRLAALLTPAPPGLPPPATGMGPRYTATPALAGGAAPPSASRTEPSAASSASDAPDDPDDDPDLTEEER